MTITTNLSRRHALAGLATLPWWPGMAAAQTGSADALRALLAERLRHRGVAYAAFEIGGPDAAPLFAAAGREGTAAPPPEALFELGSITKTFTTLLLADTVQRGRLKLDDPVEAVLPDGLRLRDSREQPLRWIDLATQRSGLPPLPDNLQPADPADPYAGYGWADMRIFLRGWQPQHERGARFEYSNLGFGLLGQALGFAAGGRSYGELLQERVLAPLGLAEEIFLAEPAGRRRMPGHDADGKPVPAWHFRPAMAATGALLGTTRGLARYAEAALGRFKHPLAEAFALCLQRHAEGAAPINPIGLAWMLAPLGDGLTIFGHDGATYGFTSSLWVDPRRGRAAGVLSNANVGLTDLNLHLLDRRAPPADLKLTKQASVAQDATALAPLAGVYALNERFKLRVEARGRQLFAQATGQGEFELFAKAPRQFFARVAPLEILFDGESGAAPTLTLLQNGQKLRFVREP